MSADAVLAELTGEDVLAAVRDLVGELLVFVSGAAADAMEHQDVEEHLQASVREIGRLLLQGYFLSRAAREQPLPAGAAGSDKVTRTRAEKGRARLLGTVFGDVAVPRIAYRRPGSPDLHPADGQLNLPPGRDSWTVQKLSVLHAAGASYEDAAEAVQLATGQRIGKRQAEEMMIAAAADFADFYAAAGHRPPPGAAPGAVLALSCDATGVVVLPDQRRPEAVRATRSSVPRQEGRLSRGEVRNRKRMAEVTAVCDITAAPRTADDILPPPGPRPCPARPPQAKNKCVAASIADDASAVVARMFAEADRRDPGHERTWIALADGNTHQLNRIRAEAAARGITVTIICDLCRARNYADSHGRRCRMALRGRAS